MTITKEKIAAVLDAKLGLSHVVCEAIVNQFFTSIQEIAANEKLTLKNFGNFKVVTKRPRPGLNFHTKLAVTIGEKHVMRFSPAKKIKLAVNEKPSQGVTFSSDTK